MTSRLTGWVRTLVPFALASLLLAGLVPAASAQTADGSAWSAGPDAIGTNTYAGFIDGPTPNQTVSTQSAFVVRGWIVDTSAQGWAGIDKVDVYDGRIDQGGKLLGSASIAQDREDVSRAFNNGYWRQSGFSLTVPGGKIAAGTRQITVYAKSQNKGWWWRQVQVNAIAQAQYNSDPVVAVTAPRVSERLKTDADYTITGYALDRNALPNQGVGVDRVEVYLDGSRTDPAAKFLGVADLGVAMSEPASNYGQQFTLAGFTLRFSPTKYTSDAHNIWVAARSAITGKWTETQVYFVIFD
ncbi:MAG: hypothetical protein HYX52_08800 [Chloroflexi bacterium]|nr:hypothetical protein [Chloroflexota bacterium]